MHMPALVQVSGLVQSFMSLHPLPGEQLPTHDPFTQAMPVQVLHALLAPPPHIDAVSLATGTQVLPLQQPVVHDAAVQTHWPALQDSPVPHIFGVGAGQPVAGTHVPGTMQASVVVQLTVVPPPHTPAEQVSLVLHMLPVLHDPEFLATGAGHPVAGTQAPTEWH
jgi:hypothetical protein